MTDKPPAKVARYGGANKRVQVWYALLLLISAIFIARLFYLQVIKHDYYTKQALADQLKQYSIPARRGEIKVHDGSNVVPIVLNQKLYTLFADPTFIKQPDDYATKLAAITGGYAPDYASAMRSKDTRYVVLAKKLPPEQQQKIDDLKLKGIGTRETTYRTYPQGDLAAQLLGFVDDDRQGRYGLEQALNDELKGKDGQLKAITDAGGVPLVANRDNIDIQPQDGKDVTLTVDEVMQRQLEDILKQGLQNAKSDSGSALILDPTTGAIKAMANYPTYNPSEFYKVSDANTFNDSAVSSPLEVGSVMKVFTAAAAVNQGVVNPSTTYFDPAQYTVNGFTIHNIEEDGGGGLRSVTDILTYSLNTGATWLLMQMGGGELNAKGRTVWHDYLTNHYQFGKPTGVEQGKDSEPGGTIPDPNDGYALNLTFANTTFGQAMTATPLQLGAALSGVVNGGTYYKPHLVESLGNQLKYPAPPIVRKDVVSVAVSQQVQQMMEATVNRNVGPHVFPANYIVGGKTGTAQIAKPGGGYYDDQFNGTYIGFVGGNQPQYVIVVRVNKPHIRGYAGHDAAQPIFVSLAQNLINNSEVNPKN